MNSSATPAEMMEPDNRGNYRFQGFQVIQASSSDAWTHAQLFGESWFIRDSRLRWVRCERVSGVDCDFLSEVDGGPFYAPTFQPRKMP